MTPLGQGGGSALFENVAAIEMALVVEMVVDRGMDGLDVFVLSVFRVPFHYAFFQKGMAAVILGQAAYWMTS